MFAPAMTSERAVRIEPAIQEWRVLLRQDNGVRQPHLRSYTLRTEHRGPAEQFVKAALHQDVCIQVDPAVLNQLLQADHIRPVRHMR
jgi:hypothetical protein